LAVVALICSRSGFASETDWSIQIKATVGSYYDTAVAGVQPDAKDGFDGFSVDAPEPPPPARGVQVYFPHSDFGVIVSNFDSDFRGTIAAGASQMWTFTVLTANAPGGVALLFTLTGVPSEYDLKLTDLGTNASYDLRKGTYPGYTSAGTESRSFTLTVTNAVHDVGLTALSASPNPVKKGQTVTFSYTVKNFGNVGEANLAFQLTYNNQPVGTQQSIPSLPPGQQASGSLRIKIPRKQKSGDYLITGEVVPVPGETNTTNNRQTVKVTVK